MALKRKDARRRSLHASLTHSPDSGPKFERENAFQTELHRRVEQYFLSTGRRQRDCPQMYVKTAVILAWFVVSYVSLVFFPTMWWATAPLALSLGLAMAAIGFNIQHDGGHNAYSEWPAINRLMAMSLDLLGANSYIWACKHNVIHHNYANITNHDDDIDIGFLGRLSPHQPRLNFHRWQHYYLWLLYGLLPIKWQVYDDFRDCITGRIGGRGHSFHRPRGWNFATLVGGKTLFFFLAFLLPSVLHPFWAVLLVYLLTSFVQGLTLGVVFQLAHCVESAAFPLPRQGTARMENSWAAHQVETTVDFARHDRLLCWFIGGLNFQVEHHLFPRICHIHYPTISHLVEETCKSFGLRYMAHDTFGNALASHFRWLRRMGQPTASKYLPLRSSLQPTSTLVTGNRTTNVVPPAELSTTRIIP